MTAIETYIQLFKLASISAEVQEIKKAALSTNWKQLIRPGAMIGLGALGVGIPAYYAARSGYKSGLMSGLTAPATISNTISAIRTGLGIGPIGQNQAPTAQLPPQAAEQMLAQLPPQAAEQLAAQEPTGDYWQNAEQPITREQLNTLDAYPENYR